GGRRLVQESRNTNADLCWHQPAAILPGWLLLAARSNPDAGSRLGLRVPVGFSDRRTGSYRPGRREPRRGCARLARALVARHRLFFARDNLGLRQHAEAVTCLAAGWPCLASFSSRLVPADTRCGEAKSARP